MKIALPQIYLPDIITRLCHIKLQNNRKSFAIIMDTIYADPALSILITRTFSEFLKYETIESMLNALGWDGFRNRVASLYLYKLEFGVFPGETKPDLVKGIVDFEIELKEFTVYGDSRLFLLGYYLRSCELSFKNQKQFIAGSMLNISDNVIAAIKMNNHKSEKIDWLILILSYFTNYLGEEKLLDCLTKSNGNFYKILPLISEQNRHDLIENLLIYGGAINEDEMFLFEKV